MVQPEHSIGERCVANINGRWSDATLARVNEDGTFTVKPDAPAMSILDRTFGVTRLELVFDDDARWAAIAPRFVDASGRIGPIELHDILRAAGVEVAAGAVQNFWRESLAELFERGAERRLDVNEAYAVMRRAGLIACRVAEGTPPGDRWYRLYWNEVRMGGRCPADIGRPITLDDAAGALGLGHAPASPEAMAAIARLEADASVVVPHAMKRLFAAVGADEAVHDCHCNGPELVPPDAWTVVRGLRAAGVDAELGIVFMEPHQGDHAWLAAFDDGQPDGPVYMRWTDHESIDRYTAVAPSLALFMWDLAQTGACWYIEHGHAKAHGLTRATLGWMRG